LGSGKAHSRFKSTEDVKHFITEQRESWEFDEYCGSVITKTTTPPPTQQSPPPE
jgi:hypothetical protein